MVQDTVTNSITVRFTAINIQKMFIFHIGKEQNSMGAVKTLENRIDPPSDTTMSPNTLISIPAMLINGFPMPKTRIFIDFRFDYPKKVENKKGEYCYKMA